MNATICGNAARVGGLLLAALLACAAPAPPPARVSGTRIYTAEPPSEAERYCAWYGDARAGILYFGESPFWWAFRRTGSPLGDLERPGPVRIGRFDLAGERLLEALEVGSPGDRAGVWDVLAHPNGRIYFTRYFEPAGFLDPASGAVRHLPELGQGLNELALAPDGRVLVSRYPAPDGAPGSVLVLDPEGRPLAEHPLEAPQGYRAGPKTVAVEPGSGRIWITMDLLPEDPARPVRHDAYVLDAQGALSGRIESPDLHFVAFAADGTAYLAEVDAAGLWLRVVRAGSDPIDPGSGQRVSLDPTFAASLDFAQEIRPLPGGGAVVTRWSGRVHVVDARGRAASLQLPQPEDGGLYYTAVRSDARICATYCADVSVVCADAPAAGP